MLDNRGFTLIEVIFTLSIIIILSIFTLHLTFSSSPHLSLEQQCNKIISFLQEAKTVALLNHEKIDILIARDQISYNYKEEIIVRLDQKYYLENSFELYFNKKGNINSGNHLNVCDQTRCKSIIFNVGTGVFYVKE